MSVPKNLSSVTIGVVLVVFALGVISAQNDLELSPQSDLESMEEIQELLRNVQLIFETKIASKVREGIIPVDDDDNEGAVDPNGCNCSGMKCSCCQRISIKIFKLNDDCCLSVTYLPRNYGILLSLTIGSRSIFSKEVSARNPPPICVGVPFWNKGASVCIQLYNLDITKTSFSGCSRFRATLLYITIVTFDLGCFRINYLNNGTQQVDEVQLPYLEGPQWPVEDPEPIYLGKDEVEKIYSADQKRN